MKKTVTMHQCHMQQVLNLLLIDTNLPQTQRVVDAFLSSSITSSGGSSTETLI